MTTANTVSPTLREPQLLGSGGTPRASNGGMRAMQTAILLEGSMNNMHYKIFRRHA